MSQQSQRTRIDLMERTFSGRAIRAFLSPAGLGLSFLLLAGLLVVCWRDAVTGGFSSSICVDGWLFLSAAAIAFASAAHGVASSGTAETDKALSFFQFAKVLLGPLKLLGHIDIRCPHLDLMRLLPPISICSFVAASGTTPSRSARISPRHPGAPQISGH
jgi:hypothetical protein